MILFPGQTFKSRDFRPLFFSPYSDFYDAVSDYRRLVQSVVNSLAWLIVPFITYPFPPIPRGM